MSVTLKDIAKQLNISVSTVSRVVNNKKHVKPETREKVLKALKKYNYQPNEIARSLKNKVTNSIAVIIPDIANTFFSRVIKGVEEVAREHRYSVFLCNTDEREGLEREYLQLSIQKQIAGVIIATVSKDFLHIEQFLKQQIPIVFIDNLPIIDDDFDYVAINNIKASFEITDHLINLGHKDIAIITGPLHESTSSERLEGWKKALKENNITINKNWIWESDFKQETGYKIACKLLKQEHIPSAIFSANNDLAYGIARAASQYKLRIPEDLAVVAFDAIDPTGLMRPQMTTIVQPAEEIGKKACEIIIRKMQNPSVQMYERIVLEHKLIIKDSCGSYFKAKV